MPLGGSKDKTAARKNLSSVILACPSAFLKFAFRNSQSEIGWLPTAYYFLNNAVYLVDDFLKTTRNPNYAGEVDYEPRAEHGGDHTRPNAISRLRYHQFYAPKIVDRIMKSAPPGADLKSWRY